jgi:SCAN domain-containing zinc finger protein
MKLFLSLVLEKFIISGHYKDKSTLKDKWGTSGRNLEKLMKGLNNCMKLSVLVHVHMQGQEALFSENIPLREVIIHLIRNSNRREYRDILPDYPKPSLGNRR